MQFLFPFIAPFLMLNVRKPARGGLGILQYCEGENGSPREEVAIEGEQIPVLQRCQSKGLFQFLAA